MARSQRILPCVSRGALPRRVPLMDGVLRTFNFTVVSMLSPSFIFEPKVRRGMLDRERIKVHEMIVLLIKDIIMIQLTKQRCNHGIVNN